MTFNSGDADNGTLDEMDVIPNEEMLLVVHECIPKLKGAFRNLAKLDNSSFNLGLKQILNKNDISTRILRTTYPEAVKMVVREYGPTPWDYLLGGNGCPKFLCDVMVKGLAKHLRCVGIDPAVPYSKKSKTRRDDKIAFSNIQSQPTHSDVREQWINTRLTNTQNTMSIPET
ncbi:3'-5' exonuclease domain-containing protein [Tanacetum coccineum]